jgi:hypothetical protein
VAGRVHYEWERFWVDAERRVEIDFEKFFRDPREEYEWLRPTVTAKTLGELQDEPCLILLGEPGLGKSRAVEDAVAAAPEGTLIDRIDLAANPDASSLRSRLTDGRAWREWAGGGQTFLLYLDSLDEATLSFPSIHKFLLEEFRAVGSSLGTLHLRLACRSAEWIVEFADGLRQIWPTTESSADPVRHMTLAPLRERDACAAASVEGLDGKQFLSEIREREVEGLAALPLTLQMMLAAAKGGSGLPGTQAELYALGLRHLLEEPDPYRRKGAPQLRMEIGERLAVAERISAAILLSRRSGVSLLPGHAGPADVDPAEIAGFQESDRLAAGGDRFDVGAAEVLETLRTALFSMGGADRVSFSHRSLGEYCAGAYLANAGLDRTGLARLLFAASDGEGRLVPQLREVAAWAAALDSTALEVVLESEADVLLRIDRLDLDPDQREKVVGAILNLDSAERIGRWDRRVWRSLRVLDHPGLPAQLNPVIGDSNADWSVRRLAITIARVCERPECETALVSLALEDGEPAWVRDDAVWALREYGSRDSRKALVPLALKTVEDDVDDEIKGSALAAVFPDLVSLEQVLAVLTPPRNDHLSGAYSNFLHRVLPERLERAELPVALRWAASVLPRQMSTDVFNDLAEGVLARAWPLIDEDKEVAHLIADIARARLKAHADLLDSIYRSEDRDTFRGAARRHRLIEELIPDIRDSDLHPASFVTSSPNLLLPEDLAWVLTRIEASLGTPEESVWVQVARMSFELPISESDFEELERLCKESEELKDHLGGWLSPVRIDSPEADSLREHHRHFRRPKKDLPDRAEEMDEVIEEHLLGAERGEEDGWWKLNYALLFNEHGRGEPRLGELEADLTALPGWRRSSPDVQARITRLARPALDREPPDPQEWFAERTINRGAFAGYRALNLLAELDRASFDDLPASVWEPWMPIVIDFPSAAGSEGESHHALILRRAAELAGLSFATWAERKLTAQARAQDGNLFFLHALEEVELPDAEERVVAMLANESLRSTSLRDLLAFALPRDPERSLALVAPLLAGAGCEFESDEARECVVVCAAKLLALAPALAYSDVAALLDRCPELGKDVLLGVAREERNALVTELADQELGHLLTWIFENFPEAKDPPMEEGYVSPRESLRDYRQWLLEVLAERGTDLAVDLIKLIHEKQETATLRIALRKAQDARRSKSPAPSPGEVVRMVRGGESVPRTQTQLLSRVVAALESIQSSLQIGQPPSAPELWNTRPAYTPKDEGDLSNWLSGRLSRELGAGFDVSRERLVSGGGKGRGKSVDLQIICPAHDASSQRLQLLIEVKGCWEPALSSKIRSQLAEGYMATTGIREAIFLVFWFGSGDWEKDDRRRGRCAFGSGEDARRELTAEALAVGADLDLRIEVVILDGSLNQQGIADRPDSGGI